MSVPEVVAKENENEEKQYSGYDLMNHQETEKSTLRAYVTQAMNNYFLHLDGQKTAHIYEMFLAEVEAPMLEVVMRFTKGNQTKASILLGINRGTLRKKLSSYDLLSKKHILSSEAVSVKNGVK